MPIYLIKNIKTLLVYKSHFIHKQTQLSPTMFELSEMAQLKFVFSREDYH